MQSFAAIYFGFDIRFIFHISFIYCRFLATGDSYHSLAYSYRVGTTTISEIIPETCAAIWGALQVEYLPHPTEDKWKSREEGFQTKFPNCIGCLDGKLVVIQSPPNSGSQYFIYFMYFIYFIYFISENFSFSNKYK